MSKIKVIVSAIILGIMASLITCACWNSYCANAIDEMVPYLKYWNSDARNSNTRVMAELLDESSILVQGSSELLARDEIGFPGWLFNNGNSDFNMILSGRGFQQSLYHAINLGGLSTDASIKKTVLIISPQWFREKHLTKKEFTGVFSEELYYSFLRNQNISNDLKAKASERVGVLLNGNDSVAESVKLYDNAYRQDAKNPFAKLDAWIHYISFTFSGNYALKKEIEDYKPEFYSVKKVLSQEVDYEQLLKEAEMAGEDACTNNEYGVYDEYFTEYIADDYKEREGSQKDLDYSISVEYDDLRLFLDICKELDVEALIVNMPLNGRWCDYTGYSKESREKYYQKIRELSNEYNVEIADFSDKEYEMYFLKDIMHIGWKGWVYLDEAVYNFYKK